VEQQGDQGAGAGTGAVVGQKGVLELVLADHVLRELHMQLVLGPAESGNAKWKFRRMCDWLAMAFANVRGKKKHELFGNEPKDISLSLT